MGPVGYVVRVLVVDGNAVKAAIFKQHAPQVSLLSVILDDMAIPASNPGLWMTIVYRAMIREEVIVVVQKILMPLF